MTESPCEPSTRFLGEYRFVLIGSFLALFITSIPYLLGAALATEERIFGGFVYAVHDCYSYLAKMRQGAEGAWLFHVPYTPEPHPGALFFTFRRLLGKIAALLPGGNLTTKMVWVYHAARWIFGTGLLVTIYRFLSTFVRSVRVRRLAWILITFGGGLGWLLVAVGRPRWLGNLPLDFISPEGFTFLVLFAFPHLALAETLLLSGLLALLRAWEIDGADIHLVSGNPRLLVDVGRHAPRWAWWRAALLPGILWLLMGLIVPFYPAVAWTVAGAAWILMTVRERRLCWREGYTAAVAVLISGPMVVYGAWRFASHPVYAAWEAQSRTLSPHPLHYVVAYGLLLTLAAFAAGDAWRSKKPTWLAVTWVCLVPLLIYLPINAQRRFLVGVQVPLSLLAAKGLVKIAHLESKASSIKAKLAVVTVLLILLPTNVLLVTGSTVALHGQPGPVFRDRAETVAMDWLSQRVSPSDAVLASFETGTYLPARAVVRVFVGQGPETVDAEQKRAQVAKFFNTATADDWRRDLLAKYAIDYVFWGPAERDLGDFDPQRAGYLHRIYDQNGYFLFEVLR
jgi:hypothetical protein